MFNKKQNTMNGSGEKNAPDNLDTSVSVWQQPGNSIASHEAFGYNTDVSTTLPKGPHQTYDQPVEIDRQKEDIFHPVKAIEDIIAALNMATEQINMLVKQMVRERVFNDLPTYIGSTVGYIVDYGEYKYLYVLCASAITLNGSNGTTIAVTANQWVNINLPRGTVLTVSGGSDVSPTYVWVRRCDVPLPGFIVASVSNTASVSLAVGSALSAYPSNPTQTAAAGADTVYNFGSAGTTKFSHVMGQNNTGVNILLAFDQSTTVSGNEVYTIAPTQFFTFDRNGTTLHFSSASQQSFGGTTGITVEGFA